MFVIEKWQMWRMGVAGHRLLLECRPYIWCRGGWTRCGVRAGRPPDIPGRCWLDCLIDIHPLAGRSFGGRIGCWP